MIKKDQKYDIVIAYPSERIRIFDTMIPLGIASLISVLQKNKYRVRFVDFNHYKGNFKSDLGKWSPRVVGLGGTTPTRFESFKIAKIVKEILPDIPVVYGGVHATFTAEDTLQHVRSIDYVIKGEGEYSFLGICEKLIRGKDIQLNELSGFCYRENGSVVQNTIARINDLDALPIPVRELEDIDYTICMDFNGLEADFLVTSRGCPARCAFCSASAMFPGGFRFRSIDLVKAELDLILSRRSHIKAIKIFDSTFTANREHVINFCKMIKPYHLLWECEIRADTVDYILLKEMRNSGCYYVDIGLETSSERLLRSIGKNITVRDIDNSLEWCKRLGIKTKLFMIFGLLDQTLFDCKKDVQFLKDREKNINLFATTFGLRVYPGTTIEKRLIKRGVLSDKFSWAKYKPSKRNWMLLEFGNTYILEQKQLSFYRLLYIAVLLLRQGTLLSNEHISKLIRENLNNLFSDGFKYVKKIFLFQARWRR
jgi:anaerobic magnesium-protoporphyrin IX monomethyl ester cyclase